MTITGSRLFDLGGIKSKCEPSSLLGSKKKESVICFFPYWL